MLSEETRQICKLSAAVLDYPVPSLAEAVESFARQLEAFLPDAGAALKPFAAFVQEHSTAELEELYTQTFDVTPAATLYFGYHLFRDTPKRNEFMARLEEAYRSVGLSSGGELADHLCVMLRFLSVARDYGFVAPLVMECILPNLEKIEGELRKEANPYGAVVRSLRLSLEKASKNMPKTGGTQNA